MKNRGCGCLSFQVHLKLSYTQSFHTPTHVGTLSLFSKILKSIDPGNHLLSVRRRNPVRMGDGFLHVLISGFWRKNKKRQPGEGEGPVSPPEDPAPDPSGFKGSPNVT